MLYIILVLDAIDQYLGPLTKNFCNHVYQLLRKRHVEQIENRDE